MLPPPYVAKLEDNAVGAQAISKAPLVITPCSISFSNTCTMSVPAQGRKQDTRAGKADRHSTPSRT